MYPTWRYHKKEEAKIIHSEKEEHKDWKESPAHFAAEIEEAKFEPKEVSKLEKEISYKKPKKKA